MNLRIRRPGLLRGWQPLPAWIGISFLLHLIWETAQLPLYTISLDPDKAFIAFAVIHCLAGDVLIATITYGAAAFALRDMSWSITRPWRGAAIAIPLGVLFTAASEWYNVHHARNWQYLPSMPLLFDIGVSPLLQWLFVPVATLLLSRRRN